MSMVHFISPQTRKRVLELAQSDNLHVLLLGDSGTGKGAIAKWIHAHSPRSLKPFVVAKPDQDLFTLFQEAQGGSIYFPEIAQWPQGIQKRLAHYIQKRTLEHNGVQSLFQVRLLAASDESLANRVQAGLFHADLYNALIQQVLTMPPLEDRKEELDDIATGLLSEMDSEATLSPEALKLLHAYSWPGNLRELRNVLRFALQNFLQKNTDPNQEKLLKADDFPKLGEMSAQFKASREAFEKWLSSQDAKKLT